MQGLILRSLADSNREVYGQKNAHNAGRVFCLILAEYAR